MKTEQARDPETPEGKHVCSWQHVGLLDNFLRPLIHNPRKLFSPYVQPGMTVMDLGCGKGFASLGLARLVGADGLVISVDLQQEMLDMVKERAAKAGLSDRIRLHRSKADQIGLREELDFALAFWMFHELPDGQAFLKEIFAMLKLGGRFFLIEPTTHVSRDDFESTINEAQEVGFRILERPRVLLSRAAVLAR